MSPWVILIIIFFGLLLLIINKWRYDVVALILLAIAVFARVVPYDQVFVGFMNPAVTSVASIMIITRALAYSNLLYFFVQKTAKLMRTKYGYVAVLVTTTTIFSMFMNNVGALGLVLPIAIKTADEFSHSRSIVLMPMAFGAGLGGLCTSFGTPPNLIISNFRKQVIGSSFSVFDFAPVGLSVTALGLAFLIFIGWRMLSHQTEKKDENRLKRYLCEVVLKKESQILGLTLNEINQCRDFPFKVFHIVHQGEVTVDVQHRVQEYDRLLIEIAIKDLEDLVQKFKMEFRLLDYKEYKTYHFVEAVVTKNSRLIGQQLKDMNLSGRFDFNVIGVKKTEGDFEKTLSSNQLQAGDAVLIATKEDRVNKHAQYLGLMCVNWLDPIKKISLKNFLPLIFFFATVALNIAQIIPLPIALGATVLLIILFDCLPLRYLYESINWPVIVLLATMIPIAQSFQDQGGADLLSEFLFKVVCKCHPKLILGIVMGITILLSDLINNTATALIMAPIAINLATNASLNVDPFLMAVAVGASCSFGTPIGHQNNVIVYNIGKYKFIDYVKLGVSLEIIVFIIAMVTLPYFWPLKI